MEEQNGAQPTKEEFLQNQVLRLSAALRKYQEKHGQEELDSPAQVPSLGSKHSWLMDEKLLSPLLQEYDNTILQLEQQVQSFKSERAELHSRVQQLVNENARLHTELRHALEAQVYSSEQPNGRPLSAVSEEMAANLQQQLEVAAQERDSYRTLWEQTAQESTHLQTLLKEQNQELQSKMAEVKSLKDELTALQGEAEGLIAADKLINEERQRSSAAARAQLGEMEKLRSDLRCCQTELRATQSNLAERQRLVDEAIANAKKMESQAVEASEEQRELREQVDRLEKELTTALTSARVADHQLSAVEEEREALTQQVLALQQQRNEQDDELFNALQHVRSSVEVAESAMLTKEEAVLRQTQLQQDIAHLEQEKLVLINEASAKLKEEVESVRVECGRNVERLLEDMHKLEVECGEKQSAVERAVREKRALEKEVGKLRNRMEPVITEAMLQELRTRTCHAERARDEAIIEADELRVRVKQNEARNEEYRHQAAMQLEDRSRQLGTLTKQCSELREMQLNLTSEVDSLKRKLRAEEDTRKELEHECEKRVAVAEQQLSLHQKGAAMRLQTSEECQRHAVDELRKMLTAQQRLTNKWRDEARTLSSKCERTVKELRSQADDHRRRCLELSAKLEKNHSSSIETEERLAEATHREKHLEEQLAHVQKSAKTSAEQAAVLLSRERQLLQERKTLQHEVQRLQLELSRLAVKRRTSAAHTVRTGAGGLTLPIGASAVNWTLRDSMKPAQREGSSFLSHSHGADDQDVELSLRQSFSPALAMQESEHPYHRIKARESLGPELTSRRLDPLRVEALQ